MIKADTERPFVIIYGWEVKEAFPNSFAIENKGIIVMSKFSPDLLDIYEQDDLTSFPLRIKDESYKCKGGKNRLSYSCADVLFQRTVALINI